MSLEFYNHEKCRKTQVFYKLNKFQGWISHIQGDGEKSHKLKIIRSEACVEWTFFIFQLIHNVVCFTREGYN